MATVSHNTQYTANCYHMLHSVSQHEMKHTVTQLYTTSQLLTDPAGKCSDF